MVDRLPSSWGWNAVYEKRSPCFSLAACTAVSKVCRGRVQTGQPDLRYVWFDTVQVKV